MGLIPAWGRPLEKENGNPLQYSCLKKSHWQSLAFTVCGVTKSHTQLSNWCIHSRWRPFTSHEEDSHQKINLQKPWSWISNCHNTDKTNVYYLSSQSVIDISCHLKSSPEPLFRCQLFHLYPLNFPPITQTLKLMILYFIACFQLAKPSLFPILPLSEWHSLSYNISQNPRIHSWHFFLPCASYSIHPSIVFYILQFSSVQLLSHVWLFATPWTAACQASLSITNSQSPPKPMSLVSVMPSNHIILCRPHLLSIS